MMRITAVNRWLPITALILLFTVVGCTVETTASSILANPAQFDGKSVSIQGAIVAVKETTSRAGNDYATFEVRDVTGGAVKVFTWGHPDIMNGDPVQVIGVFQQVRRVGQYTFYNEIEARSIVSGVFRPRA
jgi:RecJ-like exonuclease